MAAVTTKIKMTEPLVVVRNPQIMERMRQRRQSCAVDDEKFKIDHHHHHKHHRNSTTILLDKFDEHQLPEIQALLAAVRKAAEARRKRY
ncbi:hypothetical protein TVAG_077300 [Trichomonas vaginalis G3]|uniref:Uncharacterized protein n=1 Tax=Trichomonas vaginalis (strain ATCC PRA-98 / G3) TaxID=412133 RepID=A2E2T8_TRIV3|nr:hypothetical protein TVAGG3_0896730 [Trichomonas vaginalis G3]EAY12993.1 hypothetical protein TVAG_077300 [Trichomonas vaginalis G3]KAI5503129.1 hypothetical protein TVAGG3_0896730 [Trichomonas vaginalis G3]|eukprot:XP_001325216.1 hypothetical protein [Trichomonas vaginalis G3]